MAKKKGGKKKLPALTEKQLDVIKANEDEVSKAPHSFVLYKNAGKYVQQLALEFRKVMEPFTASKVECRKRNSIKDYISVAGLLKVSHLAVFSQTDFGPMMRIGRFPRGPSLYFKIKEYMLSKDVRSTLKKQVGDLVTVFHHHPLVVLNNFPSEENEYHLCTSMFQNMFPAINVEKVHLNGLKRCVLFNYDKDTGLIEFRHYVIKVVPTGVNRVVKRIVTSRIPNLSKLESFEDIVDGAAGCVSESEFEDDDNKVVLPEKVNLRGNVGSSQSSVRLTELGPRMNLELFKIEEGLFGGEVIYHRYITKTKEEVNQLRKKKEKEKRDKTLRKKIQEQNVKKKEEAKKLHKEKSLLGIKRKREGEEAVQDEKAKVEGDSEEPNFSNQEKKAINEWQGEMGENVYGSDDDDAEYFRQEVGDEPDVELFSKSHSGSNSQKDKQLMNRFNKTPGTGGKSERGRSGDRGRSFDRGGSRGRGGFDRGGSRGRGGFDRGGSRGRGGFDRGGSRGRGGFDRGDSRGRGGSSDRGGDRGRGGRRGGPGSSAYAGRGDSRGGRGGGRGFSADRGGSRGGGRGMDRDKKKKRPTQVFNSAGIGPDYKKGGGGGSSKLKGVKGGKVKKRR